MIDTIVYFNLKILCKVDELTNIDKQHFIWLTLHNHLLYITYAGTSNDYNIFSLVYEWTVSKSHHLVFIQITVNIKVKLFKADLVPELWSIYSGQDWFFSTFFPPMLYLFSPKTKLQHLGETLGEYPFFYYFSRTLVKYYMHINNYFTWDDK